MKEVTDELLSFNYPIISVTHKPMDLGKNIVVQLERSLQSIYKQVLIGAKNATTEYVALTEDDIFYNEEHFKHRSNSFAYNINRWTLHMTEKMFSYRDRPVLSQCICPREMLIKNLEERFALPNIPDAICGEPGRLECHLGITPCGFTTFKTEKPTLCLSHTRGITGKKIMSPIQADYVEGLGYAKDWIRRLT
jgi:hypothetical protein